MNSYIQSLEITISKDCACIVGATFNLLHALLLTRFHLHPFVADQTWNSFVFEFYSRVVENVADEFSSSAQIEVREFVSRHHGLALFHRVITAVSWRSSLLSSPTTRAHPSACQLDFVKP